MNPEIPAVSQDEDGESTISPGASTIDLKLSSSDEEGDREREPAVNPKGGLVQESKTPQQWEESMLRGRQPVVESVTGCVEHQGHLVYLVREQSTKELIVVPASYVDRNFPQRSIEFYERLVHDQLNEQ